MSEPRFNPPFRAEHIGSFLRPPELLRARAAHEAGQLALSELRAVEDRLIHEVVARQEELGFKVVTDGEYRRGTYTDNFTTSGISGVKVEWTTDSDWTYTDAKGHKEPARMPIVYDRIRWHGSRNAENFAFLKSVAKATPKMTLPGPCYIHFRAGRQRISRGIYPHLADFWSDLIAAYHTEFEKLAAAGCTYVQLDETSIAKLGDPKIRKAMAGRGDNWQELLGQYIDVINAVVDGVPPGIRIGMHLCRGNRMGHWQAEGGYDAVAEQLFRKTNIDFFFLEYDSPRAGSFEPLRLVPEHKVIVLGLVSTKVAELETEESIIGRIRDCARFVDLERLAVSPQCGFSSSDRATHILTYDRMMEKLRRVIGVARKVWAE